MVYLKKYSIHLFIMLFLSALVSFSFEDNTGSSLVVLDVEHIAIEILNPLQLYLHNDSDEGYFKEGDGLNVSITIEEFSSKNPLKLLGAGKLKHLKMIFTNLETGEEFEVLSQDFAQTIKFGGGGATTGNYSIKITGTKRPTPMTIKITKYLGTPLTEEELNTPYDMVRIESMYIGEYSESQPRFFLPLNEGDRLSVSTSSALPIKFKRENDGMLFNVPQPELAASNSETWKLLFNLELPEDKKGILKLRTSNKRFIDLRIRRFPYIDPSSPGGAGGGLAGANGAEGGVNGMGGAGEGGSASDNMARIMAEMSESSNKSSADMMKLMAEMNQASLKAIEEMNKKVYKKKPAFVATSSEEEENSVVAPKLDLTGKNRFCKRIQFSDKGLYWAYWIGVGKESKENFDKAQLTTLERKKPNDIYASLIEHYATNISENVNKKIKHPGFTMIKNRMLNAGEFIEYAIVDELNKEKFEAGQNYTPARPGWAKRNAVVDHGNSAFMEGTALFLCLCNENKMSPVDVFFKYEIYDLEEVQQ